MVLERYADGFGLKKVPRKFKNGLADAKNPLAAKKK